MNNLNNENIVLKCSAITKNYLDKSEQVRVLNNLSLSVKQGENIAIVGSSGSGKTTLLNILAGIDTLDTGEVYIEGKAIHLLSKKEKSIILNQKFGFVYQFHHLLAEFTALENVAMPLMLRKKISIKEIYEKSKQTLVSLGLSKRLKHMPSQLSGGERQRVAIARAIVGMPSVVFMDEPTGNLDHHTATSIHETILSLNINHQISFIVVTHDMNLAKKIGKIYFLNDGKLQTHLN